MGIGRRSYSYLGRKWLQLRGITAGHGMILYGMPYISRAPGSTLTLGSHVALCSNWRANPVGITHPVILRTLRPDATLTIGDHTGISGGAICAANSIRIGSHCLLGANVTITDTDFHTVMPEGRRYNTTPADISSLPIVLEDNIWIGMNVTILKGVTIGRNTVVGAGSIVSRSLPANVIACGIPARVVGSLSNTEVSSLQ